MLKTLGEKKIEKSCIIQKYVSMQIPTKYPNNNLKNFNSIVPIFSTAISMHISIKVTTFAYD